MPATERPPVDVVDSTWLAAAPAAVGKVLAEPVNWREWWPGLHLRVQELRGAVGVRWFVDAVDGFEPALAGSAEVWLESTCSGTVAHFFLRLDSTSSRPVTRRLAEQVCERYRSRTKQAFWRLGDQLDPGRLTRLTSVPHVPTS
ncbi:polyketide cyclase / dehydrase and lipid transport [uncultured Jatrophihabitans sp.]|uniref:polyketide cyclase / dehydrase and lipid transport n=1 Tax=uncultured Jatrophihabitans sp. TaxID=1610747 RepID=UPI0035CBC3E5